MNDTNLPETPQDGAPAGCPMSRAGLGEHLPSRNNAAGQGRMTMANGSPVYNNQDSMTAGPRGPVALQDAWLLEKHAHFNREVIPERRMHAKGSGAWGTFTVTRAIPELTRAAIFSTEGNQCELFMRFSTVAGERGAADAERDIRGFAMRFFTSEGNWDVVGNNTPVFFFRDGKKFIDLNHAVKRDPRTNLRSPNTNWDFWTSLPESLLQVTITMSDRGIPLSYRYMHGFSSHAYSFINAEGVRTWVKFHFRSQQGLANLTDQEAATVIAEDRESNQRDLYESIEKGQYPRWTMYVQTMTVEQAEALTDFNPFDLTKMWPKADFPFQEVGVLELNRNPDNYFQDVEQAGFTPQNIVPGIGYSPDRMLQARLFSYGDAQRYRLGVNHHQIPVNAPRGVACPHGFHRDGAMRVDGNAGSQNAYEPNSYGNWQDSRELSEPVQAGGDVAMYDFREDDHNYYTQPGMLWRAMTPEQQLVLCENTARAMGDSTLQIKHRHIFNCYHADPDYGRGVAQALGIDIDSVDLDGATADSYELWLARNRANAELDVPTSPAAPVSAANLGPAGRDTNVADPTTLTDPMNDPYVL